MTNISNRKVKCSMVIISQKAIHDFATKYPLAADPLNRWCKVASQANWRNFLEVKESFNATVKCTGRGKRKTCDIKVINGSSSPYKVVSPKSQKSTQANKTTTNSRYTVRVNHRKGPAPKPANKVKPQPANPASNKKNNLNTEPVKKNDVPAQPVAPSATPAAPVPATTLPQT